MKESEVPSDFEVPIFKPNLTEFANFKAYIESLENLNISFAKVSNLFNSFSCNIF